MLESENPLGQKVADVVGRLAKLVQSRFGCELRYMPFEASTEHAKIKDKLLRESPVKFDGAWLFPVFRGFQMIGCAEVVGFDAATEAQREQITDLVELYLESTLTLTDRLETLQQIEKQISRSGEDYGESTNVLPLRRPSEAKPLQAKTRSRLGFALPCLVEAQCHPDIKAMAMELHDLSGRYAFLYFDDVTWRFGEELKDLGPITLFIPDVAQLSIDLQLKILKYLSSAPSVDEPQIIAGTLRPYAELRSRELILTDLLHRLSVCFLRMDRPFAEYHRDGIVEFFFGSLVRDDLNGRLI